MRCRYYQWILSRSLDTSGALPQHLRRHLAACGRCRRHYDAVLDVDRRLRAAVPAEEPWPDELQERIARLIRSQRPAAPRLVMRRLPWVAAGLAAACLALAVIFLATRGPQKPEVKETAGLPTEVQPAPLSLDDLLGGQEALTAVVKRVAAAPLKEEMNRLAEEARSAGRTLLACVPVGLANVSSSRGQPTTSGASRPAAGHDPSGAVRPARREDPM